MTTRRWSLLAATGLALVLNGCAQSFDATNLGVPATMANAAGETPVGQPFRVSTHTIHGLWGTVTLKRATLDKALANQLVGAKEIAQLKIKTKTRWTDLLFTGLTLGLIAPKTVVYEGVAVGR